MSTLSAAIEQASPAAGTAKNGPAGAHGLCDSGMEADTVGPTICPFAYIFGGNLPIRTKNLKILCFLLKKLPHDGEALRNRYVKTGVPVKELRYEMGINEAFKNYPKNVRSCPLPLENLGQKTTKLPQKYILSVKVRKIKIPRKSLI
ncbi:MAG: hypothetical protein LBR92_02320 [Puniceicoccales bacterium]|nr:hypothetical protein [Puniceicoccales bacterium]